MTFQFGSSLHHAVDTSYKSLRSAPSADSRLIAAADPASLAAEKFRMLGVHLLQIQEQRCIKKLVVTSTVPEEGKSFVSANLAVTLAQQQDQRVLLIDGDLRRPVLDKTLGVTAHPGLSDCLLGSATPDRAIRYVEDLRLWFVSAGSTLENPVNAIGTGNLGAILSEMSGAFDWVIIDCPPLIPVADTTVWSRLGDGILFIARHGMTRKRDLKRGLERLDKSRLLGVVVNSSRATHDAVYYERYSPKENRSHSAPIRIFR